MEPFGVAAARLSSVVSRRLLILSTPVCSVLHTQLVKRLQVPLRSLTGVPPADIVSIFDATQP